MGSGLGHAACHRCIFTVVWDTDKDKPFWIKFKTLYCTFSFFKLHTYGLCLWVILYLTGLNYYGLLKPFFFTLYRCVCVRNVILHHFRYKEVRFKKNSFSNNLNTPSRSKQRQRDDDVTGANMARAVGASQRRLPSRCLLRLGVFKLFLNTIFFIWLLCIGSDVESHCEHIHIDIRWGKNGFKRP